MISREIVIITELLSQHFQNILADSLTGLYLHGSICLGDFHWETSDIDLLVVLKQPPTNQQKRQLLNWILAHWDAFPAKGLEMSLVSEDVCRHFQKPTPYYFHFSPRYLTQAQQHPEALIEAMQGFDPDLACHFALTYQSGIALYGPLAQETFAPISSQDYLASVLADLQDGIGDDPAYYILNCCRTLAYLEDGIIRSKGEGGKWALTHQLSHPQLIRLALSHAQPEHFPETALTAFYQDYSTMIDQKISAHPL